MGSIDEVVMQFFVKIIYGVMIGLFVNAIQAEPAKSKNSTVSTYLIGTYAEADHQGVELLSFNEDKMALSTKVIASGIRHPSFVIANRARTLVFATEEVNQGKVRSYRYDPNQQTLALLSEVESVGDYPCYLALDPSEQFLAVANYTSGNFSIYAVDDAGDLQFIQSVQHTGRSIHPVRQKRAHVHSMLFHPNGKQLLVADLGTDRISIYDVDFSSATPITPAKPAYFKVAAGAGPRHMVLHPDGKTLYLVHELTGELGVYSYDNGKIEHVNTHALTTPQFRRNVQAAEVRLSPDGRIVYVSNRGDANNISVFKVKTNGDLDLQQQIATGGQTPRNFNLSMDGRFLLVANRESNDVHVFVRDIDTGLLTATTAKIAIQRPAYIFSLQ